MWAVQTTQLICKRSSVVAVTCKPECGSRLLQVASNAKRSQFLRSLQPKIQRNSTMYQLLHTICLEQVTATRPISQQFQLIQISCINPPVCSSLISTVHLPPSNHPHTHTHTPFNGPLSGTTQVSRYQKGKTNLDFTEARDSEWQWHQLAICKSAPRSRQITTPAPHHSVFFTALKATKRASDSNLVLDYCTRYQEFVRTYVCIISTTACIPNKHPRTSWVSWYRKGKTI